MTKSQNLESLRTGMYGYIEIWYNNSRIYCKIGFISPNEYEESHWEFRRYEKESS
ncbi:IS3 family transposase [Leptotrichia sp.]